MPNTAIKTISKNGEKSSSYGEMVSGDAIEREIICNGELVLSVVHDSIEFKKIFW